MNLQQSKARTAALAAYLKSEAAKDASEAAIAKAIAEEKSRAAEAQKWAVHRATMVEAARLDQIEQEVAIAASRRRARAELLAFRQERNYAAFQRAA